MAALGTNTLTSQLPFNLLSLNNAYPTVPLYGQFQKLYPSAFPENVLSAGYGKTFENRDLALLRNRLDLSTGETVFSHDLVNALQDIVDRRDVDEGRQDVMHGVYKWSQHPRSDKLSAEWVDGYIKYGTQVPLLTGPSAMRKPPGPPKDSTSYTIAQLQYNSRNPVQKWKFVKYNNYHKHKVGGKLVKHKLVGGGIGSILGSLGSTLVSSGSNFLSGAARNLPGLVNNVVNSQLGQTLITAGITAGLSVGAAKLKDILTAKLPIKDPGLKDKLVAIAEQKGLAEVQRVLRESGYGDVATSIGNSSLSNNDFKLSVNTPPKPPPAPPLPPKASTVQKPVGPQQTPIVEQSRPTEVAVQPTVTISRRDQGFGIKRKKSYPKKKYYKKKKRNSWGSSFGMY